MWTMKSHFTNFAMTSYSYYNYQLSKAQTKFGDQDFKFNLCCCHMQLAPFPAATYLGSITSYCSGKEPALLPQTHSWTHGLSIVNFDQ